MVTYSDLSLIASGQMDYRAVLVPDFDVEYETYKVHVIQRFPIEEILREDERVGQLIARDVAYAVARWLDIFKNLLSQVPEIVVRPADAVADFGLSAPDWKFTISTANAWNTLASLDYTKEGSGVYGAPLNALDKRLLLIRGFVAEDPDPIVRLFRVKRKTDYSAPVDIYACRNVKGWVILRKRIVLAKDTLTLEGYATSTGDVYLVFSKFSIAVEPANVAPFYIKAVEEEKL